MPPVRLIDDTIHVGQYFGLSFQRTLRIPDDGLVYPLPPGLSDFPLRRVRDYARKVPSQWREKGGFFLPMYQCEALWVSFYQSAHWHPSALKLGVGGVNAISGQRWDLTLRRRTQ